MKRILALAALVALVATQAEAQQAYPTLVTKQVGGSTGDSLGAAADTSANALKIHPKTTAFWVVAYADSLTSYRTQVSPDNSSWFTVDFDSCAIGEAESTADFGRLYSGMYVRVITDMLVADAGGTPTGSAYIFVVK